MAREDGGDALGGKFLGLGYDPVQDKLRFEINPWIRTSTGKRGRQDEYVEVTPEAADHIAEMCRN